MMDSFFQDIDMRVDQQTMANAIYDKLPRLYRRKLYEFLRWMNENGRLEDALEPLYKNFHANEKTNPKGAIGVVCAVLDEEQIPYRTGGVYGRDGFDPAVFAGEVHSHPAGVAPSGGYVLPTSLEELYQDGDAERVTAGTAGMHSRGSTVHDQLPAGCEITEGGERGVVVRWRSKEARDDAVAKATSGG